MKFHLSLRRHPSQLGSKIIKIVYNMSTAPQTSENGISGPPL